MTSYSREYLQGLALENKKNEVSLMISLFIDELKKVAGYGATQYLVDFSNVRFDPYGTQGAVQKVQTIVYFKTLEEMIPFFQEKFPCCFVRAHEEWIDVTPSNRTLKRGILIDWSA
jgi:hypothetical protein